MNKLNYTDLLGKEFEYKSHGPDTYDCASVVKEIYRRLHIEIPDINYPYNRTNDNVQEQMEEGIENNFIELKKPKIYCLVAFKMHPRYTNHVGVVLEDCKTFIHAVKKVGVCVGKLKDWKKKIIGFYLPKKYLGDRK